MKEKLLLMFLLGIFLISFISAESFTYNSQKGNTVVSGNNYTINVNNSEYLQGYTPTTLSTLYCALTGCTMSGTFNLNNGVTIAWGGTPILSYNSAIAGYYFGNGAGSGASGTNPIFIGTNSGLNNTGNEVTAVGYGSGYLNTGSSTVFIGRAAGDTNSGNYAVCIGRTACNENTGAEVTAVGYRTALSNTGDYVTALGTRAGGGNTGSNSVYIGYQAGYNGNEDNKLIITQQNINTTPLIKGDFLTGEINISGNLRSGGEISGNNLEVSQNITTSSNLIISNGTSGVTHWNMYEDGNGTLVWEKR